MVDVVRSNDPDGRLPVDASSEMARLVATGGDVRELQRTLWVAAKRSPGRRFHALFDRVWRGDVLQEAWRRVQRNKGAAGVDRQTLAAVEEYGAERLLAELQRDLREGLYRPRPVRRVQIPKPQGGMRPLGIPTVTAYRVPVQRVFGFVGRHASVHPLHGQRLEVLFERRRGGAAGYVCEGGPLGSVTLPEARLTVAARRPGAR